MIEGVTEINPSRALITAGWDTVPHLDTKTKDDLLRSTMPHLREARSKGIPSMGAGAIYPIPFEEISCAPFQIPAWYPKGYALDVGWKCTAAVWGAWDRETDVLYLTSEYKAGRALPVVHAEAIKTRGTWMNGVIDPGSAGASQRDGEQLIEDYRSAGLNLTPANNAVEAGLLEVWQRMETGRLKIFRRMNKLEEELRLYRRRGKVDGKKFTAGGADEYEGQIVKDNDHLCDAMRYLVMGFKSFFTTKPMDQPSDRGQFAADRTAGY